MTTTLIYHGKDAALKTDFSELDSLHVRDLYALDEQDKKKKKKDKKSSSSKKSKSSSSKLGDAPAGSELEVLWNRSSTRAEGLIMGAPPTPVTRQPSSRVSLLDNSRQLEPEGRSLSPPRRHHSGGGNSSRNGSKLGMRPPPPPPPPPLEEPPVARFEFVAKKRTPYVDESMKDASDMTDVTSQTSGMLLLDASSPDSRRKSSRTGSSGTLRDFSDISGSRGSRRRGERRVSHLDPPTIATTTTPPSTRMSRKQRMQARASASASAGMDGIHGSAPDATGTSTRRAPTAETLRRSNTDQGVTRALPQPTKKIPGKSKSHSPSRPARIGRRHRHHSASTAAHALIVMEDQSMPEQQLRKEGAPAFRRANTDEGLHQRLHKESSSSARRTTVEGILYFTAAKEGQPTRRTTIKGRVLPPPPPPPTHSPTTQKTTKPKATLPKRTTPRQRNNSDLRREASEASLKSHGSSKRNNNNEPPRLLHLTNDLLE